MSNRYNISPQKQSSISIEVLPPKKEEVQKEKEINKTTGIKTRKSWVKYYLDIARSVSERSSCYRHQIGCVIVKNKQILSTGYNGAPSGRASCYDYGFCYRDLKNIESGTQLERCLAAGAHAEGNAITQAAKNGVSIKDADLFLVGCPFICDSCKASIINAGILNVYLEDPTNGTVSIINVKRDWTKHPIENEPEFRKCRGCKK